MITVKFQKEGESLCLWVSGHASAAEKGADLICAGATMLVYTLAQAVCFAQGQGKLREKPTLEIHEGRAQIVALPTEEGAGEILHTFRAVQAGFHVLAHNYPKNVTLEAMKNG